MSEMPADRVARPEATGVGPPDDPPRGGAEGSAFVAWLRGVPRALVVPSLALLTALAIGAVIIIVSDRDFVTRFGSDPAAALGAGLTSVRDAYVGLIGGSIGSPRAISETLLQATPLILTGLAVAVGFRAGLFNIGAEGQLYAGAASSIFVGFALVGLPAVIHLPLAILAGIAGGAFWGFIPGFLKARTGAHEVIVTIMLNYVAYRFIDWLLNQPFFQREGRTDQISRFVEPTAELPRLIEGFRTHWGIFLALAAAVFVSWLLFRSTRGFEFRAVGLNPSAARYAGMSIGGTLILAMMVSGGLAGLAGASEMLGSNKTLTPGFSPGWGFDAIALALLGGARPLGVVFAALLFGALRAGATPMQVSTGIPIDLVVVIQALVIMFIAAPALVRGLYRIKVERRIGSEVFTKGWGA
jgi:general nucleoside transport system permease protein